MTIPAWVTTVVIGLVDPSVASSSSPLVPMTNVSTMAVGRMRSVSPVSVTS
jgi:hypothetical protein